MALASGTCLGSFEIIERLGAGGMGEVYRAHDTRLQRDVAIKILQLGETADGATRKRLLREARAAAGLNHPFICTIHEVGEADGLAYIAMEYVDGRSLGAVIGGGSLSMVDALRVGRQLADGLAHAHDRGIVHGDLKPANVIVAHGGCLKLLDFGLSRRVDPNASTMTQPSFVGHGVLAGTLAYMAPEQLRGAPADTRSDVWALGVILNELASASVGAIVPLRDVIGRCLEQDPARRYANAGEARAALEALAAPSGPSVRPSRLAAAAVAVLVLVGASLAWWLRERSSGMARLESIAVLPFTNSSGDARHEYLAATLADQLGVDLGNVGSLTVLAGQATERYKTSAKSALEIGRELATSALVQGSTLVSGNRVRVTVRLIETSSQRQLWAQTYDDDLGDVLRTSKVIVRAIVQEIKPALTGDQQRRLERIAPAVDPAVLELLQAGRATGSASPDDFRKRRTYIERAIALAPDHAPAHRELAVWYRAGINQNLIGPPAEAYAQMRRELTVAMKLDPDLAEASSTWGDLAMMADWDWATASTYIARAVELNPSSSAAYNSLRYYYTVIGRHGDALAALRRFRALYPTNPNYFGPLGFTVLAARDYVGVDRELEREGIVDVNLPPQRVALRWRAAADVLLGHVDRATNLCGSLVARSAKEPRTLSVCGFVFGQAHDAVRATTMLDDLTARAAKGDYVDPFLVAAVYAGLARSDEMFAALGRAADEHSSLVIELPAAPWFDAYHADSRYQALVRRIGFPQHQHERPM